MRVIEGKCSMCGESLLAHTGKVKEDPGPRGGVVVQYECPASREVQALDAREKMTENFYKELRDYGH